MEWNGLDRNKNSPTTAPTHFGRLRWRNGWLNLVYGHNELNVHVFLCFFLRWNIYFWNQEDMYVFPNVFLRWIFWSTASPASTFYFRCSFFLEVCIRPEFNIFISNKSTKRWSIYNNSLGSYDFIMRMMK